MRIGFLLILFLIIQSCSTRTNNQDDWGKNNIRSFEVDDPNVARAMKAAQDSLGFYIDYYNRFHGERNYRFFLKKNFEDDGEFEHMWSKPIELNERGFTCILDNEPNGLRNYKLGDTLQIDFEDIEDFIIVTADTIEIGNYLQKELADK